MKKYLVSLIVLAVVPAYAASPALDTAIDNARRACGGISDEMVELRRMAGINTAVTGVGTAAGAGAVAVGIAKSDIDKEIEDLEKEIAELKAKRGDVAPVQVEVEDKDAAKKEIAAFIDEYSAQIQANEQQATEQEEKSKNLGNWRTGLLAANTATNVAGAVIAGGNDVDIVLDNRVRGCVAAVDALARARMTAQIDGTADAAQLTQSQEIVRACSEWETVDLTPISKRARGAAVASSVGAGVGLIGTIVSASANSEQVRDADDALREKNLNTTANVMAGGATVASGAATVLNATQIGAVKRAVAVAEKCEGVL